MAAKQGTVVSLQISPGHGVAMEFKPVLKAIADQGLDGDSHARKGNARQVLFMDEETLAAYGLKPGRIKENITTRGIELKNLSAGTFVRVGSAMFEITKPCSPCAFIEDIRPGLREEMQGQRGMLARVVQDGELRVGDPVEILEK